MELSVCATDADYEAWRAIRIAVVPGELCPTVEQLRDQHTDDRLLMLAAVDDTVVGSGIAGRAETAGAGFAAPRVLPGHRRRGVGSTLLRALAEHCSSLGLPRIQASVDDEELLAFADHFGFVEVDREIEQVRAVGDEPSPASLPADVEVVTLRERPELWAASFETFGRQVLADFALHTPLEISADEWNTTCRTP
jgi:mycothiol synthase